MPNTTQPAAWKSFSELARSCLHITRRNWAVYKKDLVANISPSIADPAFLTVALGMGLGGYVASIKGHTYLEFLAPGLCVATALMTSFFETSYGFYVRLTYENVYKAMLTTPIGPTEIVLGEFLWVGLKGAAMSLVVAITLTALGLMKNPALLPIVALMGFGVGVSFGALGLIGSALVRNINQFQSIYSFVVSPLYFLSGIFYPLDEMPRAARFVVDLFPLSHGVRISQAAFWNQMDPSVLAVSFGALVLQSLVFGTVAMVLIRKKLIA